MQNPTIKNNKEGDNGKIYGSKKRNNPVDDGIPSNLRDNDDGDGSLAEAVASFSENNTNNHYNADNRKDMLDLLFSKQNELYKKQLDNSENKMKNLYKIKEPFEGYRLFMLSTALVHEAIELQRETNWKWWKKENNLESKKIQEEIIDIWHFLIQLSIEAGLDSRKLIELYIKKNKENLNRQIKGY
jgi:dimeric dUTPase (all-alpha-NTP-PPase superfamily)